jgi:hypothetical protein
LKPFFIEPLCNGMNGSSISINGFVRSDAGYCKVYRRISNGCSGQGQGNRFLFDNNKKDFCHELRELRENNNGKTGEQRRNNKLREDSKERAFSFFAVFASGSFLAVASLAKYVLSSLFSRNSRNSWLIRFVVGNNVKSPCGQGCENCLGEAAVRGTLMQRAGDGRRQAVVPDASDPRDLV